MVMKPADGEKKQVLLRLSPRLYDEVSRMADAEFRSVNAQIEYILSRAVVKYKGGKAAGEDEAEDEK